MVTAEPAAWRNFRPSQSQCRLRRRIAGACRAGFLVVVARNPFANVAGSIQNVERTHIGGKRSYRCRPLESIQFQIRESRQGPVTPDNPGHLGSSSGLLPLLFRRQSFSCRLAKRSGGVTIDVDHRIIVLREIAPVPGGRLRSRASGSGAKLEVLTVGDFQSIDIESPHLDAVARERYSGPDHYPSGIRPRAQALPVPSRFGGF